MKILNLYAGIGGNRKLWGDEHEVTAVEFEPYIAEAYSQMYPNDTVIVTDAHQYLIEHFKEFDFIWSSPPCPTHSRLMTAKSGYGIYEYPDMKLYEEIIFLKHFFKGIWLVENVIPYYKPLIEPTAVVQRHNVWSNKPITDKQFSNSYVGNLTKQTKEMLSSAYGIELPVGTKNQRKLLRNAVLPEMGLYILKEVSNGKNPNN